MIICLRRGPSAVDHGLCTRCIRTTDVERSLFVDRRTIWSFRRSLSPPEPQPFPSAADASINLPTADLTSCASRFLPARRYGSAARTYEFRCGRHWWAPDRFRQGCPAYLGGTLLRLPLRALSPSQTCGWIWPALCWMAATADGRSCRAKQTKACSSATRDRQRGRPADAAAGRG